MQEQCGFELVVTVVNKGNADTVVAASKRAGAEGGTILFGRGTGIHEQAKLFSIPIEPEKEVVLTLIARNKTEAVLQAILEDSGIEQPGKGIAFVLPVERTTGIKHLEQNLAP
jgi:nitrogen regulatory protein PII